MPCVRRGPYPTTLAAVHAGSDGLFPHARYDTLGLTLNEGRKCGTSHCSSRMQNNIAPTGPHIKQRTPPSGEAPANRSRISRQ